LVTKIIEETFEGTDHLVMLTAPAVFSGIYNAFRLGASALPQDRVTLIDSGTLTMGLGFQALVGAEVAAQTGDVQAVLAAIKGVRANQKVYAVPETMEYLRRSGRLSWAAASVGALLQIKPIVSATESEVKAVARVRTFSKAVDKLIELAQGEAPLDRLAILHSNNSEGAQEVRQRLGQLIPQETLIINITPVIGTHIGPGALGVATVRKAWRT
jgi:DegV family protein with EDD domain